MSENKKRDYNCPICGKQLTEGLEYQFPPRLSYWYCVGCEWLFEETDKRVVVAYRPVLHNERLCVQVDNIRGFVYNQDTGERSYLDDQPALEVVKRGE